MQCRLSHSAVHPTEEGKKEAVGSARWHVLCTYIPVHATYYRSKVSFFLRVERRGTDGANERAIVFVCIGGMLVVGDIVNGLQGNEEWASQRNNNKRKEKKETLKKKKKTNRKRMREEDDDDDEEGAP